MKVKMIVNQPISETRSSTPPRNFDEDEVASHEMTEQEGPRDSDPSNEEGTTKASLARSEEIFVHAFG